VLVWRRVVVKFLAKDEVEGAKDVVDVVNDSVEVVKDVVEGVNDVVEEVVPIKLGTVKLQVRGESCNFDVRITHCFNHCGSDPYRGIQTFVLFNETGLVFSIFNPRPETSTRPRASTKVTCSFGLKVAGTKPSKVNVPVMTPVASVRVKRTDAAAYVSPFATAVFHSVRVYPPVSHPDTVKTSSSV
jgi:hypothetical protein